MSADKPDALVSRTVRHGVFAYSKPSGARGVAFFGQTLGFTAEEAARGEALGALAADAETPRAGQLGPFPIDGDDAEVSAWLVNGTVDEIAAACAGDPELTERVAAAEKARGEKARATLLAVLDSAPDESEPTEGEGDDAEPDEVEQPKPAAKRK